MASARYSTGSQLAQAAAFLASHKGKVQLVTIDIGANDLNPCLSLPTLNQIVVCLEGVFPQIQANLTSIMNTLTTASGSGVPPIIGMNYYDPELANWLKGDAASKALAKASIALAQAFGNLLSGVYTAFGAKVADVFTAFHTDPVRRQGHPARVRQGAQGRRLHLHLHLGVRGAPGRAEHPRQHPRLRHHRQHVPEHLPRLILAGSTKQKGPPALRAAPFDACNRLRPAVSMAALGHGAWPGFVTGLALAGTTDFRYVKG